jgi:soluble lytic murein transglycosylase-like protein
MTTDEIKQAVIDYAYGCKIDPGVALAQAARESANFRQDVIFGPYEGGDRERGLMQFTPDTWAMYGTGSFDNAFDIDYNLSAWCAYMQYLLNLFNWDYQKALTAYNGGPGHLTNPAKYGGPSQAAISYGQQLAAQAWYTADSTVATNGGNGGGGGDGNGAPDSGLSPWLIAGAVGLALVIYMRK